MSKEILSQEEIDSLLQSETREKSELSSDEKDVIGEVGNISMGAAATALHNILDRPVQITTPRVSTTTMQQVIEEQEKPVVLVEVEYLSGLEGVSLLLVNEEDAAVIADLMLGGDGQDLDVEIGEMQLSAMGEAMNQMIGSASTSMSQIFNREINISPPRTEYITLEDKVESSSKFASDEEIVQTSFRISIGDLVDSTIMQLAPLSFLKEMVQKLVAGQLSLVEGAGHPEAESRPSEEYEEEPQVKSTPSPPEEEEPVQEQRSAERSETVQAQKMDFEQLEPDPKSRDAGSIEILKDIPLQLTVRLGKSRMTIKEILELGKGSIIELDRLAGEDVDLLVNGKLIAKGEVVVIEENFAFRIKKIISPMERLEDIKT